MNERLEALLEKLADCAGDYDAAPSAYGILIPDRRPVTIKAGTVSTCRGLTVGDLREARRLLDEMRRAR